MNRYHSLLCAVNLNEGSQTVVEAAAQLASRENIHLLHVCEHPITGYGESIGSNHRVTEAQIKQHAFPQLSALAELASIDAGNTEILFGEPVEMIRQAANHHHCDLIVIGSHGRQGLQRLLGSTASSMLHGTPCDVLTIHLQ